MIGLKSGRQSILGIDVVDSGEEEAFPVLATISACCFGAKRLLKRCDAQYEER